MKQHLDVAQTAMLVQLGFPQPKSVSKLSLDLDMDTVPTFGYSIGELIGFLPINIHDEFRLAINPTWKGDNWFVDYENGEVSFLTSIEHELIDSLYDMCTKLKREGII